MKEKITVIKSGIGAMMLEIRKSESRRIFEILRFVAVCRCGAAYRDFLDYALFAATPNEIKAEELFARAIKKSRTEARREAKLRAKAQIEDG